MAGDKGVFVVARTAKELEDILQRTIDEVSRRLSLREAYLFGSYANGTADDNSDIDIALFSPTEDNLALEDRFRLIARVRYAVQAEIELHLYSDKCLKRAEPSNIYGHILATGRKIA